MDLQSLPLRQVYSSRRSDLVEEFYNPVLGTATKYDRVTGFFSPRVLAMASRGFSRFLYNGGKIRLLTSIELDENTIKQIKESKDSQLIDNQLLKQLLEQPTELERNYLSVFSYLLANDQLEMRVTCLKEEDNAILHEKVGIVTDADGNKITFSGSNNETESGWTRNIEQFKVFRSWNENERAFLEADEEEFEQLWNSNDDDAVTIPVSQAIKQGIIRTYPPREPGQPIGTPPTTGIDGGEGNGMEVRGYQQKAVEAWAANSYNGIFEMATGTGKTWTALLALQKLIEEKNCHFITIAVPLKHLIPQWLEDINRVFSKARITIVNSDYPDWRAKLPEVVRSMAYGYSNDEMNIVMTTYASFSGEDYKKIMSLYPNIDSCLVADEVHNAKTDNILSSIDFFNYRLGLSATPKNEFIENDDPQNKINRMIDLFGGIIFRYPLEEAIGKDLVRYEYHPIFLQLNDEEMEKYQQLSRQISACYNSNDDTDEDDKLVTALLNKRAMIIKNAEEKTSKLPDLLRTLREKEEHKYLLVYCDNKDQIKEVQSILYNNGINSSKITYGETAPERVDRFNAFKTGMIDCLVARKCLDEGVNIPAARRAILIASNTDQREYIQRLGRILRTYKNDVTGYVKDKATVYDFVVLPPFESIDRFHYMVMSEGRRVRFFINNSINKEELNQQCAKLLEILEEEEQKNERN